jgi:hypothetical protein
MPNIINKIPIINDMPYMTMINNKKDCDYPAFNWAVYSSQIFAQRIEGVEDWYLYINITSSY